RQHPLLVRNSDVGADKATERKPKNEILEFIRRHGFDDITPLDAERPQPVMMDHRRARMRGRPSDQAGGGGPGSTGHGSQFDQDAVSVNAVAVTRKGVRPWKIPPPRSSQGKA